MGVLIEVGKGFSDATRFGHRLVGAGSLTTMEICQLWADDSFVTSSVAHNHSQTDAASTSSAPDTNVGLVLFSTCMGNVISRKRRLKPRTNRLNPAAGSIRYRGRLVQSSNRVHAHGFVLLLPAAVPRGQGRTARSNCSSTTSTASIRS